MDYTKLPVNEWNENNVKCWLESTGIKKEYVEKLHAEEVTGPALMELDESFLKSIGMKGGQIHMLICKRNKLRELQENAQQTKHSSSKTSDKTDAQTDPVRPKNVPAEETSSGDSCGPGEKASTESPAATSGKRQRKGNKSQPQSTDEVLELSNCRPFRSQNADFKYVKDRVLAPESGVNDLITPCHEYKSFAIAAELNKNQLQSKFACEVIRFASACMNIRTNGTIHFGIVDSVEDRGWKHGQIIGIKVKDREHYVDALDYIEKCFPEDVREVARKCIHPPVFVEVISKESQEQRFVVEVDIEPTSSLVKNRCFEVYLPKYNEGSQKVNLKMQF